MQVWLFDSNLNRRAIWQEKCHARSVEIKYFELPNGELFQRPDHSRLVVFDQLVVGDLSRSRELVRRLSADAVAFSLSICHCRSMMRLTAAGAKWVLDSNNLSDELDLGLGDLLRITQGLDQTLQRYRSLAQVDESLSVVERDVLNLVLEGLTNKQIATQLQVSVRTVEARRAKVYSKYSARSIVELVRRVDEFRSLTKKFQDCDQCVA